MVPYSKWIGRFRYPNMYWRDLYGSATLGFAPVTYIPHSSKEITMKTVVWTAMGRCILMLLLAFTSMLAPTALHAQEEDAPPRFRLVIMDDVPCNVIICYSTVDGGICTVFPPGTGTFVLGGEPFTIVDIYGTPRLISERIGCLYNVPIAPSCCVNICYMRDPRTGGPMLVVTRPPRECRELL